MPPVTQSSGKLNDAVQPGDPLPPRKRRKTDTNPKPTPKSHKVSETFMEPSKLLETGLFSDVKVIVGEEEHCFRLHKAILCQNSGYFNAALDGNFKEGKESKIYLTEHNKTDFDVVVYWLYHGRVPLGSESSQRWGVLDGARMFNNAIYFDVPSLKTKALEQVTRSLTSPYWVEYYKTSGGEVEGAKGPVALSRAFQKLLEHYSAEAASLDQVLRVLSKAGYLPQIMKDKEVRAKLEAEPRALGRLLEIQLGMV